MYLLPVRQNKRKNNKQQLELFVKGVLRLILFTEAFKNCIRAEGLAHKGCFATIVKILEKYL